MSKQFFMLASLFGFVGIAGGAFGAHVLRDRIDTNLLNVFETAVRYQLYHVFALFVAGWGLKTFQQRDFLVAGWLFVVGVALFSGSLYIVALTGTRWVGAITPLGGVSFLLGWLSLAMGFWKTS